MKNKLGTSAPKMVSDEIFAVHSMLHLIFHRNKNQHRGTKWWKWLSILKRTTGDLAASLSPKMPISESSSTELCRRHLAMHIVPRCYLEFSTVVADGQFSTLGTVLVAVLARLARATGIDRDLKTQTQAEKKNTKPIDPDKNGPKEDAGVLVRRTDDIQNLPVRTEARPSDRAADKADDNALKGAREAADVEAKPPKKKKKKKNAIDDLFAGVI